MVLLLLMRLDGRRDLPPPFAKQKKPFAVKISQVALSGTDWRVRRKDLTPVDVLITAATVATTGRG